MNAEHTYTITISCPDRVGIVAAVSRFIADRGGWITEASHHSDRLLKRFYMRQVVKADSLAERDVSLDRFQRDFTPIARGFDMSWSITDSRVKKRVVILVSKYDHCLVDLLYRWRSGELDCEIPCVISNHPDLRAIVEAHDIPYHHVPVPKDPEGKAVAFEHLERLFEDGRGDVMVLARYMQIVPPEMTARLPGRIINIHHSFLPSFIGARPYQQAFVRGVKLIGATSHYVTEDLDEGPIIEQDVVRIDHSDDEDDLVRYGRDIEKSVLTRGLKYHLEDRVLLAGNRTVVFR
jgi:formyltetrahydrofolate deformylase